MSVAYLLIGGNMGNRLAFLEDTQKKLKQRGIQVVNYSSIYETAAWGKTDQPSFLNQVVVVETNLTAQNLLVELLSIEKELGRSRAEKNGPRTIDIDILYFEKSIIREPGLCIPHERIPLRKFVLVPLAELIPTFKDPSTEKTISQMLSECTDQLEVELYKKN
ncbi:MAG: 2-amino-4-hydroxy-6-hydroxymethyldihydropteridine diphosphokinase [Bacteroidota bacterium]